MVRVRVRSRIRAIGHAWEKHNWHITGVRVSDRSRIRKLQLIGLELRCNAIMQHKQDS